MTKGNFTSAKEEMWYWVGGRNPSAMVGWYLALSYSYYHNGKKVVSDQQFDKLCKKLLEEFDVIEHPHKHLIDKGNLEASTAFTLTKRQYPTVVRYMASELEEAYGGT